MMTIEWTSIIIAMLGMVSCWWTWFLDRRKHKQEVEGLKKDNRQKDMELAQQFVKDWQEYIAEPLQQDVDKLRLEVAELRHAIESVSNCPYRDKCPVRDSMQHESYSDKL